MLMIRVNVQLKGIFVYGEIVQTHTIHESIYIQLLPRNQVRIQPIWLGGGDYSNIW